MADKSKIIIFDDGSDASKVLEFECQQNPSIEVETIKVKHDLKNIESYIKKAQPKDEDKGVTCYAPFTLEDFVAHDIDGQRKEMASRYPNVGVFYAYEFMTNDAVKQRAELYGLKKETEEPIEEGQPVFDTGVEPTEEEGKKSKSKKEK